MKTNNINKPLFTEEELNENPILKLLVQSKDKNNKIMDQFIE